MRTPNLIRRNDVPYFGIPTSKSPIHFDIHNFRASEIILNGIARAKWLAHLNSHKLSFVLLGLATFLISACSSPPAVAEFSATTDSGNTPLDVSFVLGELADGDSFSWDFGDGAGSSESEPTHTFLDVGTFNVSLTVVKGESVATAGVTVTVEPGEVGWIVLEGGGDSAISYESIQFLASAFDVLGNPIADPSFKWVADPEVGEVDGSGNFTPGTNLGKFDNAVSVELERLGTVVSQGASVEIVEGPLNGFSIEPNELDVQVGHSQSVAVRAVDEAGHPLDSVLVLYTAVRDGDGVDSSGLFTPSTVASEEDSELLSVEVELDGVVIDAIVSGRIRPGILDQMHVSSLPTSMEVGETFQLSTYGTDRFGNELDLDDLQWSVSDPKIGSISDAGLFTAGTDAGEYVDEGITVRGIVNDVESVSVATVAITPGVAGSIHIVPDNDSVPLGAGSPFVVLALDAHGNVLEIEEEEYEFEYSTAGRGNEIAVFIAGFEIGDFENAITVTLPAGTAGNESPLVVQSDVNIRARSSNIIAVEVIDQDGGGIFFVDLETAQLGSADIGLHNNDAVELSPAWWPDGSRLVYVSDPTGELQVYTLDLTTREIVQLTDVVGGASMPSISPDGGSIVFVNLVGNEWQLYVAEIPGDVSTNPITLGMSVRVSDDGSQHILPFWSPDGTQILASQNTPGGRVRVMLFDPTLATAPTVLGPPGSVGFGWTTDGSGVHIGLSTSEGALDLGTLDLNEQEPVFIETNLEFLVAAWAPDDSELVAIDSSLGAGWLLDSDSTGLRRVVSSEQVPTRMSWRPKAYGDPVAVPVLDGEPTMLQAGDQPMAPVGALDTSLSYSAVVTTNAGVIEIDLFDDLSPMAVENFVNLSRIGFYEGLEFHRVIVGFMLQAGDPFKDGSGGPGYIFNDEFSRELSHDSAGVLSMANGGSNTNGSQFFISHNAATWLDAYENGIAKNCADDAVSCHTIFGRVTAGLEIVTGMVERDPDTATEPGVTILSILIVES
jgi:cyclophilin family peptidyl-prolyl cis-trans isomerase/PKD repeat protein